MNEGLSRPRALFSLPTGSSASQHVMLPSLTLRGWASQPGHEKEQQVVQGGQS